MSSSASSKPLYLVTGGTGFLGSHLVPTLLKRGVAVRILCRTLPTLPSALVGFSVDDDDVEIRLGSVVSLQDVMEASEGVSGIFHLAGLVVHSRQPEYERALYATNEVGTMNVMRAALKRRCKVVYASSSGVVACTKKPTLVSDKAPYCTQVAQHWPYYFSKINAERNALQFAAQHSLDCIAMRPSVMLGPGDHRYRSTHFILSFLERTIPVVPSGGYSFVDVRDAAEAFVVAMEKGRGQKTYLLASTNLPISRMFERLTRLSGVASPWIRPGSTITWTVARVLDSYNRHIKKEWKPSVDPVRAEMGAHHWSVDASAARDDLSFKPRDGDQTIIDTINWIQKHHQPAPLKAKL